MKISKLCPVCNKKPEVVNECGYFYVECNKYFHKVVIGPYVTQEKAINSWNKNQFISEEYKISQSMFTETPSFLLTSK